MSEYFESECPHCLERTNRFSGVPEVGNIMICAHCGGFGILDKDLNERALTDDELAALPESKRATMNQAREFIHFINDLGLMPGQSIVGRERK